MSAWDAVVVVAIVGILTYAMRASVIVLLANRTIPAGLQRVLRYVGPAVLTALAVNLAAGGEGGPSLESAEAAALAVAGVLAVWRRHLLVSLSGGMITLWMLSAVW